MLSNVVLPAPLGPRIAVSRPGYARPVTPLMMVWSPTRNLHNHQSVITKPTTAAAGLLRQIMERHLELPQPRCDASCVVGAKRRSHLLSSLFDLRALAFHAQGATAHHEIAP